MLYGQRVDDEESARKSVQLFKHAVETSQQLKEQRNTHSKDSQLYNKRSSSTNNLAVVMESGSGVERDVEKAKELYLRAVETDENPIAMYNLAVLLKFGDPSAQNLEKAKSLFPRWRNSVWTCSHGLFSTVSWQKRGAFVREKYQECAALMWTRLMTALRM